MKKIPPNNRRVGVVLNELTNEEITNVNRWTEPEKDNVKG